MNEPLTPSLNLPRSPKPQAFLRAKDHTTGEPFESFVRWVDEKTIQTDLHDSVPAENYEALTAAYYHHTYERACGVQEHGGTPLSIMSFRGLNIVIRKEGTLTFTVWSPNSVAALAPLLNPATETIHRKVARIEHERDEIEKGIYSRMIAEGIAREWCTEFDGILDSTGLPPRKPKGKIVGTLRFEFDSDNIEAHRNTIEGTPTGWTSVIPTNRVTLVPDSLAVHMPLAVSRYS